MSLNSKIKTLIFCGKH